MCINIVLSLSVIWRMMEELQPAGRGRVTGLRQHKVLAKERNSSQVNYRQMLSHHSVLTI